MVVNCLKQDFEVLSDNRVFRVNGLKNKQFDLHYQKESAKFDELCRGKVARVSQALRGEESHLEIAN